MTISTAAFGYQINWEDDEAPPGHVLSFKQAFEAVGTGLQLRLLCPKWIFEWAPIKEIREARDGFAEFQVRSPRTRPPANIPRLSFNLTRVVIFSADDQRAEALR